MVVHISAGTGHCTSESRSHGGIGPLGLWLSGVCVCVHAENG